MHVQSKERKLWGKDWQNFLTEFSAYLHLLKWVHKIIYTFMSILVLSFLLVMSLNFPSTHLGLTLHTFCLHSEINPVMGSAKECLNL